MATVLHARPAPTDEARGTASYRTVGLGVAIGGLSLTMIVLIAGVTAGVWSDQPERVPDVGRLGAWTFGLTVTAFGTVKFAIAVILAGILLRIWIRVDSLKVALPKLKPAANGGPVSATATIRTPYGDATVSRREPSPLLIHRIAHRMWAPMLLMGAMVVLAGFVVSLAQTGNVASDPDLALRQSAWVQGLQFLGEGFLLSGISFLLSSILAAIRSGGGEVQESLGVAVKTLKMPTAAKAFIGLMMLGLMIEVFQFVGYVVVATFDDPASVSSYFAWLGPTREVGLGLLLSGIVLALASIANALGFQFSRIREIIQTGR